MNEKHSPKIRLEIESRLENTYLIGLYIKTLARDLKLDNEQTYLVELAVIEAINNVILHAYESQTGNPVTVEIIIEEDEITFQIFDNGKSMQRSDVQDLCFDPSDKSSYPEQGMGLTIMKKSMDKIEYKVMKDKNQLTMIKKLLK